jgi:hypothetical protein
MYELIAANKRRSVLLLLAFVGLLVLTGFAVGLCCSGTAPRSSSPS